MESPFAAVRLRTTVAKRFNRVENVTALIGKLLQVAQSAFRKITRTELLAEVYAGEQYADGEKRTNPSPQIAA